MKLALLPLILTLPCHAQFDARILFASDIHETGEVKQGWGIGARYYNQYNYGIDLQLMAMTPKDSLVDRYDVFGCRKWEIAGGWTSSVFAGYGYDREDREHGPSIGSSLAKSFGDWFMEGAIRTQNDWGAEQKTVVTIGLGRTF